MKIVNEFNKIPVDNIPNSYFSLPASISELSRETQLKMRACINAAHNFEMVNSFRYVIPKIEALYKCMLECRALTLKILYHLSEEILACLRKATE